MRSGRRGSKNKTHPKVADPDPSSYDCGSESAVRQNIKEPNLYVSAIVLQQKFPLNSYTKNFLKKNKKQMIKLSPEKSVSPERAMHWIPS
jgi:hypothetical protein